MINFFTRKAMLSIRRPGMIAALLAISLLMTVFVQSAACAQVPRLLSAPPADPKATQPEVKEPSPEEQRELVKRALAEVQAERDRPVIAPPGISPQDLEEHSRLLDGLIARLNSQLNLLDEREEVRRARTAAEQKAKSWVSFPEPPPYSVLFVDGLKKQVQAARSKAHGIESARELFAQQVATDRELVNRTQEKERLVAEELEQTSSPEERSAAAWSRQLAGIRTRTAEAVASWSALRYEVLGERLGVATVELDFLERQLVQAGKQLVFRQADLDKALAGLASLRSELEQELNAALARNAGSVQGLAGVQQELDSFNARHGAADRAPATGVRRNGLEGRQRAAQAWVESSRFEIEAVSALIFINQSVALFWEHRYAASVGTDAEQQRGILGEFRKSREQLKLWLEYAQQQLKTYQILEREQEARLALVGEQSRLGKAERDLLAARSLQRKLAERLKGALEQVDNELRSWQEEISLSQHSRSLTQRLRGIFARIAEVAGTVWRFELFAVEDTLEVAGQKVVTSRGVTVGKIFGALILFLVGYWLAAWSGRRVQRLLVTRFRIGEHQANGIRRWLLALTTFILLVVTLNLARIPLAVFAFLGGALAIGVGFGTQTLIKNLICGILILLERKVQVGDIVDVDGVVGRVTAVDIRSSTVLGFDGVETVIPNSTFLENKVTNWTYTNVRLRRMVRVGVAYGSPTTQVRDILAECSERHGLVLNDPPPQVIFEDFGDNALIFILYFWINFGPEDNPVRVASDLRFMIEERLAQEGISMAFPQRDVHLDSAQPLRVEIVSTPPPAPGPPGGGAEAGGTT